jgi:drug/metabolite transporter (DMT)-like permease
MDWFFLAFSSALLSALAAITQKKVLFSMPALEFSFLLALFNMLLSLPLIADIDLSTISSLGLFVLYGKTILGTFAFWCVMLAIKNLEISGALPLLALTPGAVALFAFILIGEELNIYEIIGMLLMLCGTYIIDVRKNKKVLEPFKIFFESKNHRYILLALSLFTASSILDKVVLVEFKISPYNFIGLQHLFLAVNFSILICIFKNNPIKVIKKVNTDLWKWILLISIVTLGYRYTQIEAVKIAPVALVLTVKRFSVLFAAIIGGNIFNEHKLIQKGIAAAIILAGAVLILLK